MGKSRFPIGEKAYKFPVSYGRIEMNSENPDGKVDLSMKKLILLLLAVLLAGCVAVPQPSLPAVSPTSPPTEPPDPRGVCIATAIPGALDSLSGAGDYCLVLIHPSSPDPLHLLSWNLRTGSTASLELSGRDYTAQVLPNGSAAVLDWSTLSLCVYDSTLSKPLWSRAGKDLQWGQLWQDEYFYGISQAGTLVRIRLADGVEEWLTVQEGLSPVFIAACQGDKSLVECTSTQDGSIRRLWVDWTGRESLPETGPALLSQSWGMDTAYDGKNLLFRPLGQDTVYVLPGEDDRWILDWEDGTALLCNGHGDLTVWEMRWGKVWRLAETDSWNGVLCNGQVLYAVQDEGTASLFSWDYSAQEAALSGEVWTAQTLEASNRAAAAAVRRETGMQVHYAAEGAGFNALGDSGYLGEAITDPLVIHLALTELEIFIQSYPQGIFQEMVVAPVTEIQVYLSGPLSPGGEDSLNSAAGFTTVLGDVRILVMNLHYVTDSLFFRQTMAHEFMHAMEDRIYACEQEDGISYLGYWESFAPAEDAYFYSYFDESGLEVSDPAYTAASGLLPTQVSFLDSYSRSYPHEDRARILEYLYAGQDSSYAYLFQGGVIREKAQYLCAVIRVCFPSCQEQLPWETLVEPVDFSQYQAAVEAYVPVAKG